MDRLNSLSKRHFDVSELEEKSGVRRHRHSASVQDEGSSPGPISGQVPNLPLASIPKDQSELHSTYGANKTRFVDFRMTDTQFNRDSQLIARLKQPKKEFQPVNPFTHNDFRGLVHVDGTEALEHIKIYRSGKKSENRLSSSVTENLVTPSAGCKSGRSSSTCMRRVKPSATMKGFPKPLNSGLLSPGCVGRRESLGMTISANTSSWGNLCRSCRVPSSGKEELRRVRAEEKEREILEKEAQV